jgi:hypothetical protein
MKRFVEYFKELHKQPFIDTTAEAFQNCQRLKTEETSVSRVANKPERLGELQILSSEGQAFAAKLKYSVATEVLNKTSYPENSSKLYLFNKHYTIKSLSGVEEQVNGLSLTRICLFSNPHFMYKIM